MRTKTASYMAVVSAMIILMLAAGFTASPARAGNIEDYSFAVPKALLKNKKNAECVRLQNDYFNNSMHQILANEFALTLDTDYGYEGGDDALMGDVCTLTKGALRILRNAVYARHGKSFNSKDLQQFFYTTHKKMFKKNAKYKDSMLTKQDKENIALILKMEK